MHVTVCICTYKRPAMLRSLLTSLGNQDTGGTFTYSIVVVDNDHAASARSTVADFAAAPGPNVRYFVEPNQSIPLARNKGLEQATGDFVALIDDDEEAGADWLFTMIKAIESYEADGVLGPVITRFATPPPEWIRRGRIFERPSPPTGTRLDWRQTRNGNALLRRAILEDPPMRFPATVPLSPRARARTAHLLDTDVEFFRRLSARGLRFVWCAEAEVYETVTEDRYRRSYLLRRALARGLAPHHAGGSVLVSLLAVPVYGLALPVLACFGQHVFMPYLIKACDHLGRILAFVRRTMRSRR